MTERVNLRKPDKLVLRTTAEDGTATDRTLLEPLPIGRINYGGRPPKSPSPSSILPPEVTRFDMRGITGNGDSHVVVGLVDRKESLTIYFDRGEIGSSDIGGGQEVLVFAANAMRDARGEENGKRATVDIVSQSRGGKRIGW